MGERKAVNKYYPPDWDPSMGGLDKYHGVHPLRERANKLHLGIMVIRFEMPFNIWCGGCENHIGMGVRYNAEKKKIGMYYTTPIWQFRMKCHLCDNYIEMHTDPQVTATKFRLHSIASGGRRKEERYDQNDAECAAAHEPEERKRLGTDPMFKLQYQGKDEAVVEEAEPMMDKLQAKQDVWKDDYLLNRSLRKRHRDDRKSDKAADKFLKKEMGLDVKMLPTTKNDKITSSLVRFTTNKDGLKLNKKSAISSIFTDKRTKLLTSLKHSGVKCSADTDKDNQVNVSNLVKVQGKRRRSAETSSSSSSFSSSSSSSISSSEVFLPAKKPFRRRSEPSCNISAGKERAPSCNISAGKERAPSCNISAGKERAPSCSISAGKERAANGIDTGETSGQTIQAILSSNKTDGFSTERSDIAPNNLSSVSSGALLVSSLVSGYSSSDSG
ncbi:coiled-coil domain-containing protein 130 homolog [Bolinopsis microptera]|uniref:coiled-coil domain-containing protein 130 homolog n=1 Tax=Bolinopsis microptera TaxID=2820187 RepID=UPI00307984F5